MKKLQQSTYAQLLTDIQSIIETGRAQAKAAMARELTLVYWQLGRRILNEKLTSNAGYGEAILNNLAGDLKIGASTLRESITFARTYPTMPRNTNLYWAHYRKLSTIHDPQKRIWYEEKIVEEKWSRDQLRKAVDDKNFETSTSQKNTSPQIPVKLIRPTNPTYLYKAEIKRVIDGDTLLLNIDLGFQVWKEQRVRLASVDTPEIKTPEGIRAFNYVLNTLASVDFVMVKTNKIDIYGRYIGDIFYSFNEKDKVRVFLEGTYLNEELLKKGLASKI
ncbi:MAG: endonuclease YncB(thermonuclease family) [Candidatus Omnitrophota bacterium]|jgi:endonuclease YncB( thermonuclease family)